MMMHWAASNVVVIVSFCHDGWFVVYSLCFVMGGTESVCVFSLFSKMYRYPYLNSDS